MIYLNLCGGLGNQLFEYAFARNIALKENQNICVSTYEISFYDKKRTPTLKMFTLPESVTFTDKKPPWYVHRRNYVSKILRNISPERYFRYFEKIGSYIWYQEKIIEISRESHLKTNRDIFIGGYWQSEKYFKDSLQEIKRDLKPRELSSQDIELIKRIEAEKAICLHIRRGDYVGTPYHVCSVDYYNKAVACMRKQLSGTIFVFSDDIEWAKENVKIPGRHYYVENRNADYIELYMMSRCHSFIISNSTFSWWAQELGDQEGKIVVAPSRWHNTKDCQDIYLDSWQIIDV